MNLSLYRRFDGPEKGLLQLLYHNILLRKAKRYPDIGQDICKEALQEVKDLVITDKIGWGRIKGCNAKAIRKCLLPVRKLRYRK